MRLLLIPLLFIACTNDSAAQKALEEEGYTDIKIEGADPWACSDNDFSSTQFSATNPKGKHVNGIVCCGVLKACTIRHYR